MIGLSNTKLDSKLFLEIVKEFRRFIAGGGTSNNLISFMDSRDEEQKKIINSFLSKYDFLSQETEDEIVKDEIMFHLLDSTKSAYLMKDLVSGAAFPSLPNVDLSKTLLVYYENSKDSFLGSTVRNDFSPNFISSVHKNGSNKVSVRNLVSPVKAKYTNKVLSEFSTDKFFLKDDPKKKDKKGNPLKVPVTGHFAKPKFEKQTIYINDGKTGDTSKLPENASRLSHPSLGAFVIRKPNMGITARNSDPINIFFNAITPLEMSRCVPFINLAVVTLQDETQPKKMNNVTFMRYVKPDPGDRQSYTLDQNIGLMKVKPHGFEGLNSIFNNNNFNENIAVDVSLMDIFTSPQMMSNANINSSQSDLKGTAMGNHVLEPISPFLTLNSLSVDISGMGVGLFSSKVASMELTLHDRSRLPDIASLVAPNQFGLTKIIIEYGWSHPEGSPTGYSDNKVAQFLNSSRDRGVYTVKSSNFSFGDGNTVKISLSLACYGSDETRSISAAAGAQIPLTVFKPTIKRVIDKILEDNSDNIKDDKSKNTLRHKEVRHLLNVSQRNTVSNTSLITYKQYTDIVGKYYQDIKEKSVKLDKKEFVKALANLIGPDGKELIADTETSVTKTELKKRIESAATEDDQNATELIYGKLYALTKSLPKDISDLSLDPFSIAVADFVDKIGDSSTSSGVSTPGSSIKKAIEKLKTPPAGASFTKLDETTNTVSMGKVFMSFIGHSLAMSGLFDEVQMFFYPFNTKAGGARMHTTASFPINKDELFEVVVKKLSKNPNMTINSFFNLIERKIMRNNKNTTYGLAGAYKTYEEELAALEKNIEELKKEQTREKEQQGEDYEGASEGLKTKEQEIIAAKRLSKEKRKEGIESTCTRIYSGDGGPPQFTTFVRPNISMYMETLTGISVEDKKAISGEANSLSDKAKYEKAICRVHIYDEEAMSRPFESFLNSLLTEGSAGRAVVQSSNAPVSKDVKAKDVDPSISGAEFKGKLKNYVIDSHPSVIKQSVKRAYPSITYGASTGTIKSINVTSNVSNNVSQVILVSSIANKGNPQKDDNPYDNFDEMTVVPATVSVTMLGNPYIQRGNQIYIDFGTNTTLDNIYTVKSVRHSITAGDFSTQVDLIFAGQGEVSSIREKVSKAIESLNT
tara:strand:- start:6233 stop:9661 length:3429 start_codon:yes stop_codon:yes gene_type:complete